jgi:hypothetical protein
MGDVKTQPTGQSVDEFLQSIPDEQKRRDCFALLEVMRTATGSEPVMWSGGIVGFGMYRYRYASGHSGEWLLTGFAPRKQNITLYIMAGFDQYDDLLQRLGTYKTGKSCLYIRRLADVDLAVLTQLVVQSSRHMAAANA